MARSHLKVYFDFDERTEELNDIEKGRLLLAMLRYAAEGQKPDLRGNERFCFPGFKKDIDRDIASYASKVENGTKGGRPAKNKPNETENNRSLKNEERRMKNEERRMKNEDAVTAPAPEGIIPFGAELTDDEISESLSRDRQIEDACKDWGLPCNPGNMIKARALARDYSLPWLLEAIQRAGNGKSQTWAYVEGILRSFRANGGIDAPGSGKAAGKAVSAQQYGQRQYTEEELLSVSDDLLAEARKAKEAAG